ncbi:MAG: cytochrome c [Xanthomonadales bacterium]|nr:cytochrome c [Gammaproteobacteria bacterium]MBT8072683.1 cytochrome c [Gammaproteobacteria bacterium]MBT8074960.1 cytochrome c [Gammaproteobacteria bacterium]NNK03525.1 cytochrome c [Xanthomonadales bacterium]NNK99832.1 cytochrome c [Xanthomonadales bacterium]
MKAYQVIGIVLMGAGMFALSPNVEAKSHGYPIDKALYEEKCTSCHGTEMYTREDRKVESLAKLKNQVRLCSITAKTKWSDKENVAVAYYLNREFYKF